MSAQTPGPFLQVAGVLAGLGSLGIGIGLVVRNYDEPFGLVWSALFVVLGVIVLLSFVAVVLAKRTQTLPEPAREVTLGNERAQFLARKANAGAFASNLILALLGGWFLVMGVVGGIEENWLWPVLAAVPAAYFLGFPVLRAAGLFRIGGVWLTPTRVVDEHYGLRTEIALTDVETAYTLLDQVRIVPFDPSAIEHKRRTPPWWCARLVPGEMLVAAEGLEGGVDGFAAEVRERAEAARNRGKRRRRRLWG